MLSKLSEYPKTIATAVGAAGCVAAGLYLYTKSRTDEEFSLDECSAMPMKTSALKFPEITGADKANHFSSRQKKMKELPDEYFYIPKSKKEGDEKDKKSDDHCLENNPIQILKTKIAKVDHVRDYVKNLKWRENRFQRSMASRIDKGTPKGRIYGSYTNDNDVVLFDIVRGDKSKTEAMGFRRAGARKHICWDAKQVCACIVTCGGLCPGLNVVINEIVEVLYFEYGVDKIYGVKGGYRGLMKGGYGFTKLDPKAVCGINLQGGTILWSSRGGLSPNSSEAEVEEVFQKLDTIGCNMLFIIGGDGTHRGAYRLYQHAKKSHRKMCIAGVPKTIDNDLGVIDSSFGFNTAVEQATKAIFSAVTEATCNKPNGVGIVKLMGRHAGYIACHATLASRQVDMCLINEDPFLENNGPEAVGNYIEEAVSRKGHAVIVVAEGAGSTYLKKLRQKQAEEEHHENKKDASGNEALASPCEFLIDYLKKHFKSKGKPVTIKYHDPSYMIRSVPANASDNVLCVVLAQNAVHGAMAGYTGFTSGIVNNRSVMIPMPVIMATSPSFLNPKGRTCNMYLEYSRSLWPSDHDDDGYHPPVLKVEIIIG